MKKRILLLLMLFSIALTKAQTVGDLFTTNDVIYEVLTDSAPFTVAVDNNNNAYPNESLTIPASVTDAATATTYDVVLIQTDAFTNNTNIKYITINATTLDITYRAFQNVDNLETVDMPNLTSGLLDGNRIFYLCAKLHTVNAPNFTGSMGNDNFRDCSLLTTFNVPGVTSVNNNTFLNCSALETISLPNLTSVGIQTFKNCPSLTTVVLTSLTGSTGTQMFAADPASNSNQIVTLDLPLVTNIGNLGFWRSTKLKNLNVPLLEVINTGGFNGCSSLETFVFPASFTTFNSNNNFKDATSLTHIAFDNSTAIGVTGNAATIFENTALNTIVVPEGSAGAGSTKYGSDTGWSTYSIVEGTLSKTATDITYSRELSVSDDWFLVSSPVNDEKYNNAYVTANTIDADGTGSNNAIAFYVSGNAVGNKWSYMEDGQDLDFTPGVGYSVKRAAATGAGNISFTGTSLNTSAITGVPVSTAGDANNLLGNPYLANLDSGVFLTANSNLSGEIWLYNQATNIYDNHVTIDGYKIAAGQGFFVQSVSATTVDFAYPATGTETGTFQKTTISKLRLLINSGTTERYAKIYFTESATTSYDKGMDGGTFTGVSNKMDVFTQLLEGNTGKNYQVQSLPIANIEATVVPVGLIAEAGKQITFSLETLELPSNIKVFLEDRQTNTITRLDEENAKYDVTLSESLNGVGRFFIHTSAKSSLSVGTTLLETVSVYQLDNATLRVAGLSQGKASVKLFNVLGKQMMQTSFEANTSRDIALPNLAKGIYIVQLETENGSLNKKIILE